MALEEVIQTTSGVTFYITKEGPPQRSESSVFLTEEGEDLCVVEGEDLCVWWRVRTCMWWRVRICVWWRVRTSVCGEG